LVLAAQDLLCWTQGLLLDGGLALAKPKTLRYRLLHLAARVVRHARRTILRLQRTWPWAAELARAFTRLRALPLRWLTATATSAVTTPSSGRADPACPPIRHNADPGPPGRTTRSIPTP
jgi:DDE family transposase